MLRCRLVTFSTLTPGPSSTSYWVTEGPRRKPTTLASTLNCSKVEVSARIRRDRWPGCASHGAGLWSAGSGRATDTAYWRRRLYRCRRWHSAGRPSWARPGRLRWSVRIGTRVGSGRGCRSRGTGGSGRSHRTGCPCERDSTGLGGTGCPRVVYRSPTGHGDGLATGDDAGSGSVAIICIGSRRRAGIGADGRRTKTMQWFAHR